MIAFINIAGTILIVIAVAAIITGQKVLVEQSFARLRIRSR